MKTHLVSCYIMLPTVRSAPKVGLKKAGSSGFCMGRHQEKELFWCDQFRSYPLCKRFKGKCNIITIKHMILNTITHTPPDLLACYVITVLVYYAVSPMTSDTLIQFTLWTFKSYWTDTFYTSIIRNGTWFRIHTIMVANICKQHES